MKSIFRVYFNHSSNSQLDNTENTATLHDKIDTLALEMREKDTILKKNAEETAKYKENNKKCVQTIQRLELHVDQNKLVIRALKQEVCLKAFIYDMNTEIFYFRMSCSVPQIKAIRTWRTRTMN